MQKFRCGGCGSSDFQLFLVKGNKECPEQINARCTGCLSDSVITLQKPKMQIDWGDGTGVMTIFES